MTVVDIVVIFVIFLSALFSLIRGFVKEAISLATWIIAIWLAATFAPKLAAALAGDRFRCIVCFDPDGWRDSQYADQPDGEKNRAFRC